MTRRQKKLTVGNTDRHFNLNLLLENDYRGKATPVNKESLREIQQTMEELKRQSRRMPMMNDKTYEVTYDSNMDDGLFTDICMHGGGVKFRTDSVAPYYVIQQLASNPDSEIVYTSLDEVTDKRRQNVELSFMATKTSVEVDVKLPETGPWDLVFDLEPLKLTIDNLYLNFPIIEDREDIPEGYIHFYNPTPKGYQLKAKYRYRYFKYIQASLSIWKMNIYLICEDNVVLNELEELQRLDKPKKRGK